MTHRSDNKILDIESLRKGLPTLTKVWGNLLAEAGIYCLHHQNHSINVELKVWGEIKSIYKLTWKTKITDKMEFSWGDEREAVEYGASCIAVLLVVNELNCNTIVRSYPGSGFDYWAGDWINNGNDVFQKRYRIEVSGILKGDEARINSRTKIKIKQTMQSDNQGFLAYIIVVEFSTPISRIVKR